MYDFEGKDWRAMQKSSSNYFDIGKRETVRSEVSYNVDEVRFFLHVLSLSLCVCVCVSVSLCPSLSRALESMEIISKTKHLFFSLKSPWR